MMGWEADGLFGSLRSELAAAVRKNRSATIAQVADIPPHPYSRCSAIDRGCSGGGTSDECSAVPRRFRIARRWQWAAAAASVLFVLASFVGWPLGYLWPSAIGFVAFLPSVWLFSIKCYNCRWPACTNYEAEEALKQDQQFWTRFWGKEHGGVSLPLPNKCTKCGASFV